MKSKCLALSEELLTVSSDVEAGIPIDAISCAIIRADSVLALLEEHFIEGRPPLPSAIVAGTLWDVRGALALIKTLAEHGHDSTRKMPRDGGAQ